jgi:hypothetical protein
MESQRQWLLLRKTEPEFAGFCMDDVLENGKCIFDYQVGPSEGSGRIEATCGNFQLFSPIGCISLLLNDSVSCFGIGGKWKTRATNETQCRNFGGCLESDFRTASLTSKDRETCSECGGEFVEVFEWVPAAFSRGMVVNFTWITPENSQQIYRNTTLNFTKIHYDLFGFLFFFFSFFTFHLLVNGKSTTTHERFLFFSFTRRIGCDDVWTQFGIVHDVQILDQLSISG